MVLIMITIKQIFSILFSLSDLNYSEQQQSAKYCCLYNLADDFKEIARAFARASVYSLFDKFSHYSGVIAFCIENCQDVRCAVFRNVVIKYQIFLVN